MLHISTVLQHYKRRDVQEAMISAARGREVAVRYGNGFGKRPDILEYPTDILEFARQGATSFHASEERWTNPLLLVPGMRPQELNSLRTGWDFILDVDCELWEYAKLITHLLIKALRAHGIRAVSCKFSGNKGFHIAIPFEAFPDAVQGRPIKELFPEGVQRIAEYLVHYIDSPATDFELSKRLSEEKESGELAKRLGKSREEFEQTFGRRVCASCGAESPASSGGAAGANSSRNQTAGSGDASEASSAPEVLCPACLAQGASAPLAWKKGQAFSVCARCRSIIKRRDVMLPKKRDACQKCGSAQFITQLDTKAIMNVDTLLISSRHMFRMPYSLHEKSGLVSLPIDSDHVLSFEKEDANPKKLIVLAHGFLDGLTDTGKVKQGEASQLLIKAFDFRPKIAQEETGKKTYSIDDIQGAIPEELFPPCITLILKGVTDGRKRSVFVLLNFLRSAGWSYEQIEERLTEWNAHNTELLREIFIKSHIRYHKQKKQILLPPNCDNRAYYVGMQVCKPDVLCSRIKNPVNYAKAKARHLMQNMQGTKGRSKLSDEQKAMRKKYRDGKKEERKGAAKEDKG